MMETAAQATKPAKVDLRTQMPETAKWVDQQRQELGADHVNGCLRRALKGEPGLFWAIERGHVLGTPFPSSSPIADAQRMAVVTGATFAGFIALPGADLVGDKADPVAKVPATPHVGTPTPGPSTGNSHPVTRAFTGVSVG